MTPANGMGSLIADLVESGERLVEAISAEHRATRAGRRTELHESATALSSMRFEIALVNAKEAIDTPLLFTHSKEENHG